MTIQLPTSREHLVMVSAGDTIAYDDEYVTIGHESHLLYFGGSNGMRMKLSSGRFRQIVRLVAGIAGVGFRALPTRRRGKFKYVFVELQR